MRAVMSEVPSEILALRRRTGADRYDEVWDGVLHMVPSPANDHQELETELLFWLRGRWASPPDRRVLTQVNVSRPGVAEWQTDYGVPDLALLTTAGHHVDRGTHFEGGPDVVVEIRSPNDETDDKLAFYAAIGCREIWVIDRDARTCAVYAVVDGVPTPVAPGVDGWLRSELGVELRSEDDRVALRLIDAPESRALLP